MEDIVQEILIDLSSNYVDREERREISRLAFDTACVVLGGIRKAEASGRGCDTYISILEAGSRYLKANILSILDIDIAASKSTKYFELAFERVCLTFGDPFAPQKAQFSVMSLDDFPSGMDGHIHKDDDEEESGY